VGLPELLNAVLAVVGDEIAECLDWTVDEAAALRVLRYHGSGWPPDCCGEGSGTLVAKWETVAHGDAQASIARRHPGIPVGWPTPTLVVRYTTCWPEVKATDKGEVLQDDRWDQASAQLADVADCVSHRLVCLARGLTTEDRDVLDESSCQGFEFVRANPTGPEPACAGVEFRCVVTMVRRSDAS